MDTAEIKELQSSLRALFDDTGDDPAAVAAALDELGWADVVAEEASASTLLFEEVGKAGISTRLLDDGILDALGIASPATSIAYPLTPAHVLFEPSGTLDGDVVVVDAVLRTFGSAPDHVIIPVATDPAVVVSVPADELDIQPIDGLDGSGGWARVHGGIGDARKRSVSTTVPWRDSAAGARQLVAAELVGLARAALDLATGHVIERHQFGRAIGSFQAVRFRLAETKVAIEAAAEAIRVARVDGAPLSAAVAKALAGAAADSAVRNAAQVCGAMGLTWEFGLHAIVRRAYVLDVLLGGTSELTAAFGRHAAEAARAGERLAAPDPFGVPLTA